SDTSRTVICLFFFHCSFHILLLYSFPTRRSSDLAIADINYLSLVSGVSLVTIIGNLAWFFGYFGQPHIIVRFMSIKSHTLVPKADRKSTRLNSSHVSTSYAVFCLKQKKTNTNLTR